MQLVGKNGFFSVGQYHYSSDGFRENNDRDYLVNEARLKYQVLDTLMIQLAALEREDDFGDLSDQIVNEEYSKTSRRIKKKENYSFGFNYFMGDSLELIGYKSKKYVHNTSFSEEFLPWGIVLSLKFPILPSLKCQHSLLRSILLLGFFQVAIINQR